MQSTKKVAYLGPEASYTHQWIERQASLETFSSSEYQFTPLVNVPAIFSAVQTGQADYGVVPFYNTTYGAVVATLDSFATTLVSSKSPLNSETTGGTPIPTVVEESTRNDGDARYPEVRIQAEVALPISHCLVGHKPRGATDSFDALDGPSKWQYIQKVYSHEQGLGQCAGFLSTHLPNAERIAVTSTSRAAQLVGRQHDPQNHLENGDEAEVSVAAISSEMAAKLYNVSLLERNIQDHDDNSTRFFVLAKDGNALHGAGQSANAESNEGATRMSMIAFTVSHSSPGALARSLASLEKHQLNAVGIQQRPPDRLRKEDAIFVEVQGSEESVASALKELATLVRASVCLGHWWEARKDVR